jgi:hypothetical protein
VKTHNGSSIAYELDGTSASAHRAMFDVRNALYAFVQGGKVNYIGKTARSIRRRFVGYSNPSSTQQTNQRCHGNIKAALEQGSEVRIFVFTPISDLRYGEFQIDLAAGLEESLIVAFAPPWNGREGKRLLTEQAEREATEEIELGPAIEAPQVAPVISSPKAPLGASIVPNSDRQTSFQIRLGAAYYNQGLMYPGTEASHFLGEDGDPMIIYLGNESEQGGLRYQSISEP